MDIVARHLDTEFGKPFATIDGTDYITSKQAARACFVGEFHIANLSNRRKVDGLKHGRRTIFSRDDMEALINPGLDGKERRAPLAGAFIEWFTTSRASTLVF